MLKTARKKYLFAQKMMSYLLPLCLGFVFSQVAQGSNCSFNLNRIVDKNAPPHPIADFQWDSQKQQYTFNESLASVLQAAYYIAMEPSTASFLYKRGIKYDALNQQLTVQPINEINRLAKTVDPETLFTATPAFGTIEPELYSEMISEGKFPVYDSHDLLGHGYGFYLMNRKIALMFQGYALLEREMNRAGLTQYLHRDKTKYISFIDVLDPLTGALTYAVSEGRGNKTITNNKILHAYQQWFFIGDKVHGFSNYYLTLRMQVEENYTKYTRPTFPSAEWLRSKFNVSKPRPLQSILADMDNIFFKIVEDPKYSEIIKTEVNRNELPSIVDAQMGIIFNQ